MSMTPATTAMGRPPLICESRVPPIPLLKLLGAAMMSSRVRFHLAGPAHPELGQVAYRRWNYARNCAVVIGWMPNSKSVSGVPSLDKFGLALPSTASPTP